MTSVSSPFFGIQRLGSRLRARPCLTNGYPPVASYRSYWVGASMTSVSSPFFAIQRLGSRVRARPCPTNGYPPVAAYRSCRVGASMTIGQCIFSVFCDPVLGVKG